MKERQAEQDPFWSDDILLGEARLPSDEAYHGRTIAELVPLSQPTGTRSCIHARPYVLEDEVFAFERVVALLGRAGWELVAVQPLG